MSALHPADIAVIVAYLVGTTALGVWMARGIKTVSDFFMPRRFGKTMMITNAFGTGTAADQAVMVASSTFQHGVSGIWWQWLWLPTTPFYWWIAPIMRRLRAVTTADAYSLRYNQSVAVLFAVVGVVGLSVKIGLMLKGSGELIEASTGGAFQSSTAIIIVTVLFVLYGVAGGLSAAIVTDFVQGILTFVFSFMLLPFVLSDVGGMEGVRETLPDARMLELFVPGDIGVFFVVMFSLQAFVGIVGQPFIMGVCAAGRTEMDGRVGFMVGNIVKRLCTMAWCVTALGAIAWYLQHGVPLSEVKADHVYGDMARAFLPATMPGLMGIFIASLLASAMSSCSAFMISSSGLFTKNIYKPYITGQRESHYLLVGRITSFLVVMGGLAFAYWVPDVITALNTWFKIQPMVGIVFWMGLLWRWATPAGAWATTVAGFGTWWLTTRDIFVTWADSLPLPAALNFVVHPAGKAPAISEPWVILLYMVAAVSAGVIVSLLTKPVDQSKLDTFYALTRTPVKEGEIVAAPCTLPVGVMPAERRMITTAFGLEIPMPSATSWWGFLAGWVAVVALVAGFYWIINP